MKHSAHVRGLQKMTELHLLYVVIVQAHVIPQIALVAVVVHGLIKVNNSNVDLLTELSDKAGVECQVKTNSFLYVTVKKIVK